MRKDLYSDFTLDHVTWPFGSR